MGGPRLACARAALRVGGRLLRVRVPLGRRGRGGRGEIGPLAPLPLPPGTSALTLLPLAQLGGDRRGGKGYAFGLRGLQKVRVDVLWKPSRWGAIR